MGFILHHEHDVRGDVPGAFIPLPRKGDLRPLLPAALDVDGQDLVLAAHREAVRVQALAGDLHLLGAAREDLLQAHPQLVHHRRVLLPLGPASPGSPRLGFERPREAARHSRHSPHATHPPHAERGEGVVGVHVVVLVPGEELLKGAAATEELCEHGVRVSMEGVVVGLAIGGSAASRALQSYGGREEKHR